MCGLAERPGSACGLVWRLWAFTVFIVSLEGCARWEARAEQAGGKFASIWSARRLPRLLTLLLRPLLLALLLPLEFLSTRSIRPQVAPRDVPPTEARTAQGPRAARPKPLDAAAAAADDNNSAGNNKTTPTTVLRSE